LGWFLALQSAGGWLLGYQLQEACLHFSTFLRHLGRKISTGGIFKGVCAILYYF
jgi:hypothetical protein